MEELSYTQQLADNDVTVRMKALNKLKKFLHLKSAKEALTYEGLIKIWKGLYYCMYNADKPLVQEDLAENISQLIHELETNDQKQLFFKVALDTYGREWNGGDKFRIDKYLMLFTRTLRQCLFFLSRTGWDITEVKKASAALESSIICPFDDVNAKPLGLKTYLSSVILEELAKVGKKSLPDNVLLCFLYPFWKVLAVSKQIAYRREIKENTVFALIRQSDLGIAQEADLAPNEVIDDGSAENELAAEVNDDQEDDDNLVMDPRAGGVDVWLPQLKPDYGEVAKMFQGLGAIPEITSKNRNQLYFHARQFMNLAEGLYPLRDSIALLSLKRKKKSASRRKMNKVNKRTHLSFGEDKRPEMREKNYLKRLLLLKNAEKDLAKSMQESGDQILFPSTVAVQESPKAETVVGGEIDSVHVESVNKKKRKVGWGVRRNEDMTDNENNAKKLKGFTDNCDASPQLKNTEQVNDVVPTEVVRRKSKAQKNFEKKVKKNKRKLSVESTDNSESGQEECKGNDINKQKLGKKAMKKKTKQSRLNESVVSAEPTEENKKSVLAKKRHNFEKKVKKRKTKSVLHSTANDASNSEENSESEASKIQNNIGKTSIGSNTPLKKRKRKRKVTKESDGSLSNTKDQIEQDPWKEPLKEGETEILIPRKKLSKMQKRKMKRNLIINRTPKINTKGKTLKINLSQNREHEWKDYVKVLRKSPGIPFSANKQPTVSVLKNSDSPIATAKKPFKSKNLLMKYKF